LRVRGTLHFLDNNFDEAIKDFKLAVDTDPTPELYYYYALSLYHEGHLGAALHAIASALEVRADQPDVLRLQAQLYKETGQFDKALKSLNEALRFQKDLFDYSPVLNSVFKFGLQKRRIYNSKRRVVF
jgi:tetratricopeptide (TPR) repeat protein